MSIIDRLVSLYAPHLCVGCGREGRPLCGSCSGRLHETVPVCYGCGATGYGWRTCRGCRQSRPLAAVMSLTDYSGPAKQLLAGLKFQRAMAAADDIGRLMARRFGDGIAPDVLIVPVPTATSRVRARGYDQSVLIAKSLSRLTDRKFAPLLERLGHSEQKAADRSQRQQQLQGAYVLKRQADIRGKRIMLVDDVLTTGSTLDAVGTMLKRDGALVVGAMVFARVE